MTDNRRVTVTCQVCAGTGEADVPEEHRAAFDEIARKPASALDLALASETHRTTMNFRLEWLRRHGLATRKKVGREWVYSAVVHPPAKKRASAA